MHYTTCFAAVLHRTPYTAILIHSACVGYAGEYQESVLRGDRVLQSGRAASVLAWPSSANGTHSENVHQVDSPLFGNGGPALPQNRVDQARTTSMRRPSLATRTTVCDGEVTNRFLSNPPSGLWSSPANEGQLDLPARTRDSLSLLAGSGENRQLQTNTPPCPNDLYATESVHWYARLIIVQ